MRTGFWRGKRPVHEGTQLVMMGEGVMTNYAAASTVEIDQESTAARDEQRGDQQQSESGGTTVFQSWINLTKGYIGPGCLSLPWAFSQLGVVGGSIACILISVWTSYNCWVIVRIKRHESSELIRNYPDVGSFYYGKNFGTMTRAFICVQQLAVCTVFFSFIGENLLAVLSSEGPNHAIAMSLALPAILGLSLLAGLKNMVPFMIAATALLAAAFGLLGTIIAKDWGSRPEETPTLTNLSTVPLALCAILYSFEGICLIPPIESAMAEPKKFAPVFVSSMATATVVFCFVACFSVFAFGNVTSGSITAYLLEREDDDAGRSFLILANTAASVSVLLTYPLQMFPCLQLVGPLISPKRGQPVPQQDDDQEEMKQDEDEEQIAEAFTDEEIHVGVPNSVDSIPDDSLQLRLGLVLLTYFLAMVVPNVQALISLAGAVVGSSIGLVIPPLLELEFVKRNNNHFGGRLRCYLLLGLGVTFLFIGTMSSILDIVGIYIS